MNKPSERDLKQPSITSIHKAAQIWCEPEHAHKEMDVHFGISIARLLDAERMSLPESCADAIFKYCEVQDDYSELARFRKWQKGTLGAEDEK